MPRAQVREYGIEFSEKGARRLEAQTKKIDSALAGVTKAARTLAPALAGAFTFGAIKQAFDFAVKASIEQEQIFRALQTQIGLVGGSYDDLSADINNTFAEIQRFTEFGDTDSAKVLTQLISLTGDFDTAYRNLGITLDLAATPLFEVEGATRAVGMALTGNIELLGRYIPEFRAANNEFLKTATPAQKAAFAVETLNKKFAGTAQENIKTTAGAIKQFNNEVGDLAEKVGDILAPAIEKSFSDSTRLVNRFNRFLDQNQELFAGVIEKVMELGEEVILVASPFNSLIAAFKIITAETKKTTDETDKYGKLLPDVVREQKAFLDSILSTTDATFTLTAAQKKQADALRNAIERLTIETDATRNETEKQIALVEQKFNREVALTKGKGELIELLTRAKTLEIVKITRDALAQKNEEIERANLKEIETTKRLYAELLPMANKFYTDQLGMRGEFNREILRLVEASNQFRLFPEIDAEQIRTEDLLRATGLDFDQLEDIRLSIPVDFNFETEGAIDDLARALENNLGIPAEKVKQVLLGITLPPPPAGSVNQWRAAERVLARLGNTFEDAILRQWREGGGIIKNLADVFIEQIARMAAAVAANAAIFGIANLLTGGAFGGLSGGFSKFILGGLLAPVGPGPAPRLSADLPAPPGRLPANRFATELPVNLPPSPPPPPPRQIVNVRIEAVDPESFQDFMRRGGAEVTINAINELV